MTRDRGMVANPKEEMEEELSEGQQHVSPAGRGRHWYEKQTLAGVAVLPC